MADPYTTLEVNTRASSTVITAAYNALREDTKDAARLKDLDEAFKLIGDETSRAEYDKRASAVGLVIGNHRFRSKIAEGGFGTTYRGEHLITGEAVCIKHCSAISTAHDEVLIQEARALGSLRHHAIPAMRDLDRMPDGSLALVMDFIPHPTIEQIVEKIGKIDAETTAWITERILNALLFIHHHGVIHGDLKPQNVLVDGKEHAVSIVDFGLAQIKPTASSKSKGYTMYFAPPEQIESAEGDTPKPLLPESDFYSLGKLMIYMLGGGLEAVKKNIVPKDAPSILCEFIKRLTNPDPLCRPRGDLVDEIRKLRVSAFGRARSGMKPIPGL